LLSKDKKTETYRTVTYPAVAHRSFKLSKEHGLQEVENRMLRKILAPNKKKVIQKHNKMDY
jgi:hypothetical protein